jgi:hypothetical protein
MSDWGDEVSIPTHRDSGWVLCFVAVMKRPDQYRPGKSSTNNTTMKPKIDQHKTGIRTKPRGQQMGTAGARDQNRAEMDDTPARRGRRVGANKMAADKSQQNIGGDAVTPRTSSPSTPAMTSAKRKGESGGETGFKKRLKQKRSTR